MKNALFALFFISALAACTSNPSEIKAEDEILTFAKLGIDTAASLPEGLPVGAKSPGFGTRDIHGNAIDFYGKLKEKPAVILFYRGNWCPHCNKYMANLSDSLNMITSRGFNVFVITPENRSLARSFADSLNSNLIVISDSLMALQNAFKVSFNVTEEYQQSLMSSGVDILEHNNQSVAKLPVPATYLIDQQGFVIWSHFDYNYRNRASVKEIVHNLW